MQNETNRAFLKNLLRYFGFPLAAAGVMLIAFFALQSQIVNEIRKGTYQILEDAARQQAISLDRYVESIATRVELIANYDADAGPKTLVESLRTELSGFAKGAEIGYANPMGDLIYSDLSRKNVASESWFEKSLAGETVVTTASRNTDDRLTDILISAHVNTLSGVRGVLFSMLGNQNFASQLKTLAYEGDARSFVCNTNGIVMFMEDGVDIVVEGEDVRATIGDEAMARGVSIEELKDAMRKKHLIAFRFHDANEEYYAVAVRMESYNWYVFSYVECEVADVISDQVSVYQMAMLLIILLVGISMAAQAYEHEKETVKKLEDDKDLLKQSTQRYQLITRLSNEVFFHVALETGVISFNDTFESMFGFKAPKCTVEQLDACSDLFFEEDRKLFVGLINQLRAGDAEARAELRMVNSRGSARWKRVEIFSVFGLDQHTVELVGKIADIHRQKQSLQRLIRQADSEPLTSLLNRGAIERNIKAFLTGEGLGGRHALLMLDFDNFKEVNDTLGHARGDQLLVSFANSVRRLFRSGDYLSRTGGDEYMLFIKHAHSDMIAQDKAEALCQEMANLSRKIDIPVSISVGIAVYDRDGETFETLYKAADTALYRVKRSGKNAIAFFSAPQDATEESRALDAEAEGDELCDIDGMCAVDEDQL